MTSSPQVVSGTILGPSGSSICDYLPSGSLVLARLIDPANDGVIFAGAQTVVCPDNSFSMVVEPGVYRLRVQLPSTDAIGRLPWRFLDPADVVVDASGLTRTVTVTEGIPLGGGVFVDDEPVPGFALNLVYDFSRRQLFGAGDAVSGPSGSWDEQAPSRSPMLVQGGVRYRVSGAPCSFVYGSRTLAAPPTTGFLYPDELDRIDCAFSDATSEFTHDLTRLVVTPMAGDIGGQSSEFLDDPGRGWGVQFPVTNATPRRRIAGNQLFLGGLLIGIAPDVMLSTVDMNLSAAECGPACRDLGFDGEMTVEGAGTYGRKVTWSYTDASSPERVGLRVIQRSFDGQSPADYVLFHFQIRNIGRAMLSLHAGLYADWDIDGDFLDDFGGTELGGRLMYMTNEGGAGTYAGTLLLGSAPLSGNFVMVSDPRQRLSLSDQLRALNGALSRPSLGGPGDKVYFQALGPITLPPRGNLGFWVAVVAGEDHAQLLASAAAAEQDVSRREANPGRVAGSTTTIHQFRPQGSAGSRPATKPLRRSDPSP